MKTIKNGFTVIELLVVVVVIALLTAVLFPAINAAKKQKDVEVAKAAAIQQQKAQLTEALVTQENALVDTLSKLSQVKPELYRERLVERILADIAAKKVELAQIASNKRAADVLKSSYEITISTMDLSSAANDPVIRTQIRDLENELASIDEVPAQLLIDAIIRSTNDEIEKVRRRKAKG